MSEYELWGELVRLSAAALLPAVDICRARGVTAFRNVANEVRNALAHIEWAYRRDHAQHRCDQLQRAAGHLRRAALDASKLAYRASMMAGAAADSRSLISTHRELLDASAFESDVLEGWLEAAGVEPATIAVLAKAPPAVLPEQIQSVVRCVLLARRAEVAAIGATLVNVAEAYELYLPFWIECVRRLGDPRGASTSELEGLARQFVRLNLGHLADRFTDIAIETQNESVRVSDATLDGIERLAQMAEMTEIAAIDLDAAVELADELVAEMDGTLGTGAVQTRLARAAETASVDSIPSHRALQSPFFDPAILRFDAAMVWFVDLKGSTTIPREQLDAEMAVYYRSFSSALSDAVRDQDLLAANTWGDGLIAAFATPEHGIRCLEVFVRTYLQGGRAQLRVGLDVGEVRRLRNPVTGFDVLGPAVTRAARLEPAARVGASRYEVLCPESATRRFPLEGMSIEIVDRTLPKACDGLGEQNQTISLASVRFAI